MLLTLFSGFLPKRATALSSSMPPRWSRGSNSGEEYQPGVSLIKHFESSLTLMGKEARVFVPRNGTARFKKCKKIVRISTFTLT
jgi:hypothetical protein